MARRLRSVTIIDPRNVFPWSPPSSSVPKNRGTVRAFLIAGFVLVAVISTSHAVAATAEQAYLSKLFGLLQEAGGYLTQARIALNECLANQTACGQNSTPYRNQIKDARIGVDGVRFRLNALSAPAKYGEVHGMAVESMANISVALSLLDVGLEHLDSESLHEATIHLESARVEIAAIYDRIAAMPPSTDSGMWTFLWPAVLALVAVVGVNLFIVLRSTRRDTRLKKRDAALCPRCGERMSDFESYPLKTVEAWMTTHTSSYHPGARHRHNDTVVAGK